MNKTLSEDPKLISQVCSTIYRNFCTSEYSENDTWSFLNSLHNTPGVDDSERDLCDLPLSEAEVRVCTDSLKNNKSPGTDDLSSGFSKLFFYLPAMSQGLITLLPKPSTDTLYTDNWRPICLLNNDEKILATVLARRIKKVLGSMTDEAQSGFMANRHITNNIRLVLDVLDYSHLISDNSFLLFLDLFCNAIKTLYNNANCSVKLKHGTSPRFVVDRGVQQGCPRVRVICLYLLPSFYQI